MLGEGFIIQGNLPYGFQGQAITEQHVELADRIKGGDVGRRNRRDEFIPRDGLLRLAPAFESIHQASHERSMAIRHVRRARQEFIQGFRLLIRGFGQASCDEFANLRDAADVCDIDQGREREFADTRPDEERKVMVRAVLLVTKEVLGHERTDGRGQVR